MLVLTRRVGETIVINGDITVTVLAIKGEKARLGVSAPGGIRVDRQEIHERRAQSAATPDQLALAPVLAKRLARVGRLNALVAAVSQQR